MSEREEYEHVPWSELTADKAPDRRWLAYLAAAALVAGALGLVAVRTLWPGSPAAAPVSVETTAPSPPPPDPAATAESLPAPSPLDPAGPVLYSEADLLAAPAAATGAEAAVMKAEWFVADYFTSDGDGRGSLDVRTALPGDADLPRLPHDGAPGPISYVEWARAFRVSDVGDGLHRVGVAFRTVAGAAGEPLARQPVRAVEVVVRTSPGGVAVVDLPAPATLPLDVGYPAWPAAAAAELPASVTAAALQDAEVWGEDPEIAGGTGAPGGWRVVVTVVDPSGARWPLSLWYGDDGVPAESPPWAG